MFKDESGFSLIELAVSCAILSTLTAVAASQLIPIQQKLEDRAADIKWAEENKTYEYDMILNG